MWIKSLAQLCNFSRTCVTFLAARSHGVVDAAEIGEHAGNGLSREQGVLGANPIAHLCKRLGIFRRTDEVNEEVRMAVQKR